MSKSRSHKTTSNRIAKKYGVEYNSVEGVDIVSNRATVEIETPNTVQDGLRQLQGYHGPVYIAGTNQEAVDSAIKATKGTTIGVMNNQGNIVKRSTRKK